MKKLRRKKKKDENLCFSRQVQSDVGKETMAEGRRNGLAAGRPQKSDKEEFVQFPVDSFTGKMTFRRIRFTTLDEFPFTHEMFFR